MRKFLLLLICLVSINLCCNAQEICYGNTCFTEVYRYPQLGFYAFVSRERNYNDSGADDKMAKLASQYPFDSQNTGKFIVSYLDMPNINAFKNAPKTSLGDLESVARSQGPASGHLAVNLAQSGYILHTTFIINNGRIFPVRKYKE